MDNVFQGSNGSLLPNPAVNRFLDAFTLTRYLQGWFVQRRKAFPRITIPAIISIVMLLAGIPKFFPYGYYTLLRFVICATCVYVSYYAYKKNKNLIATISILFSIIFNPLIPIYLDKEIWRLIDILASIFLAITIFLLRNEIGQANEPEVEEKEKISETDWEAQASVERKPNDERSLADVESLRQKREAYQRECEKMLAESEMLDED